MKNPHSFKDRKVCYSWLPLSLLFLFLSFDNIAQDSIPEIYPGVIIVQADISYPYSIQEFDTTISNIIVSSIPDLDSVASESGIYKIERTFKVLGPQLISLGSFYTIYFNENYSLDSLIEFFEESNQIILAEKVPSYKLTITPSDPAYVNNYQWYLDTIHATEAWDISLGDPTIAIAIVDNGTMIDHEDLQSKIWINSGELPSTITDIDGDGYISADELLTQSSYTSLIDLLSDTLYCDSIDNDQNGYIDDIFGWNGKLENNNPTAPYSNLHHGTMVAGVAGAETSLNSGVGMASIGWSCSILPISFSDDYGDYSGNNSDHILRSIEYAVNSPARVINISSGTLFYSSVMDSLMSAAYSKGKFVIASAGNDSSNIQQYPAGFDHVIAVASSNENDEKSGTSNYSNSQSSWVALVAPGSNIYTTFYEASSGDLDEYTSINGTSFSSPLTAGLTGLMISACPNCTYQTVEYCLTSTCDPMPNESLYNSGYLGYGRINAKSAMECIQNITPIAEFEAEYDFICPGSSIQFYDLSVGTIHSWEWSATGSVSIDSINVPNPVITFPDSAGTTFTITLTVTNDSIIGPDSINVVSHTYTLGADVEILYSTSDTLCNYESASIVLDVDNSTLPSVLTYHNNINEYFTDTVYSQISIIHVFPEENAQTVYFLDTLVTYDSCVISLSDSAVFNAIDCGCTPFYNNNWAITDNLNYQFNKTPSSNDFGFSNLSNLGAGLSLASISDAQGNLLFYSDGESVYDANSNLLVNGANLLGSYNSTQNAVIVPKPLDPNKFYLFTINSGANASTDGLKYHLIDMSSGQNGEVISKNNIITTASAVGDKITWVKHGTESNSYWIVTRSYTGNSYFTVKVSPSGISTSTQQYVGFSVSSANPTKGVLKASQNGDMIAVSHNNTIINKIELLSFNNVTGELSLIDSDDLNKALFLEFSPDDQYLYVTYKLALPFNINQIGRYSLTGTTVNLSNYQNISSGSGYYTYLQISPNKRELFTYNYLNNSDLSVIVNPNSVQPIIAANNTIIPNNYSILSGGFPQLAPENFLTLDVTAEIDTNCNCNSHITANPVNGYPPYTYLWNDSSSQTTQTAYNLCPGTYNLTFIDYLGCQDTLSVTIPDITPNILSYDTISPCSGQANGYIILNVDTTGQPLTYQWSNGATSKDIYGLSAGTYSVTVYNYNQTCSVYESITLNNLPQNINISSIVGNQTCQGVCNGFIDLTVTGSPSPYSFLWNNGATTEDLSNLCPGPYNVTVYDANNCPVEESIKVYPYDDDFEIHFTDSICGCCGYALINTTYPNYTFSWSTSGNSDSIGSLCPDSTYILTIIDTLYNCSFTDSFYIYYEEADLDLQFSSTHGCGCVNDLSVTPISTYSPYNFSWSNSQYSQSQSNACPGYYWVTVTSQSYAGCTDTAFYYLQDTSTYDFSLHTFAPLCQGVFDGELIAFIYDTTNVDPAYPYTVSFYNNGQLVDNQTVQNSSSLYPNINVTSGYYYVSAIDNDGCFVDDSIYIEATYNPSFDTVYTDKASCDAQCDGGFEFILSNFSAAPYTLYYSNTSFISTSPNDYIGDLCPGYYADTIVDSNGCWIPYEFEILASELFIDADIQSLMCSGTGQGSIDITLNSYQAPYTYIWNTSATTQDITFSNYGAYSVTATSMNAPVCEISDTFTIDSTDAMTVNLVPIHPSCPGISNGGIQVNITGGASPFTFEWSSGQSSQNIDGLDIGTYYLTVTDYNGCSEAGSIEMTELNYLQVAIDATNPTCVDINNISIPGSIDLTIYGGMQPYTVNWNNGAVSEDISQLYAGSYQFTITDSIGCNYVDSVAISQPTILVDIDVLGQGCDSTAGHPINGQIEITPSGGTGPYSYLWNNSSTDDYLQNLEDFDIYSVTITDQNGCTGSYSYEVLSEQDITLPMNWSIWSTYIDLTGQYFDDIWDAQYLTQDVILMKNDQGIVCWPTYSLYLFIPDNEDAYHIKMKNPRIMHLEGSLLCPEDESITINNSWMLVPYLRKSLGNIEDMLAPIAQLYNQNNIMEIAKAGNGLTYWPRYGLNMIGNMIPGQGYQMNFNSTNISFSYPSNSDNLGTKSVSFELENYISQIEQFNNFLNTGASMTLGIPIESWDVAPVEGSIILALGESNQIVGKTIFCGGFTAMNLYGDDISTISQKEGLNIDEEFHIEIQDPFSKSTEVFKPKIWQRGSQSYFTNKISVVGTKDTSLVKELFNNELQVYPNPNKGNFTLKVMVQHEGDYKIIINLVDGKTISETKVTLKSGPNTIPISIPKLSKGVYLISLINHFINLHDIIIIN